MVLLLNVVLDNGFKHYINVIHKRFIYTLLVKYYSQEKHFITKLTLYHISTLYTVYYAPKIS